MENETNPAFDEARETPAMHLLKALMAKGADVDLSSFAEWDAFCNEVAAYVPMPDGGSIPVKTRG